MTTPAAFSSLEGAPSRGMLDIRGNGQMTHIDEIERDFRCRLTLEREAIMQRAEVLRREAIKQARQRAFLREERRRAREERAAIEEDKEALKHMKKADWLPKDYLPAADDPRMRLNVGGQRFEVSEKWLQQDKDSLLAAMCAKECPLRGDGSEEVYVDRDWWLFRYVLTFLRDGLVPQSRSLALQLYREASFWRLTTLQTAIEEAHLNLVRRTIELKDGVLAETVPAKKTKFWLNKPNWWESQGAKAAPAAARKPKEPAWWVDVDDAKTKKCPNSYFVEYDNKAAKTKTRYAPLSTAVDKVTTAQGEEDVKPMTSTTWSYGGAGGGGVRASTAW
jgi:hypothetical protein